MTVTPPGRVLVVTPVYGQHDYTHALVRDLQRESAYTDVVVVDNRGDYPAIGDEAVLRPGSNLGWAGGTNHGTVEARRPDHVGFAWLNNDTRLSAGFIAGLVRCWEETGAGLVGPRYDCYWQHQRPRRPGPVGDYRPTPLHLRAPFLDGTAMFVPAATVDALGVLDADTFAPLGWGAELDYGLRVRAAGLDVAVTALAYLHHERAVTARVVLPGGWEEYTDTAYPVARAGLEAKWGSDWEAQAGVDVASAQSRPIPRGARFRPGLRLRGRRRRPAAGAGGELLRWGAKAPRK
ncbi:MAG: glycosyltransferase family 2 protein [Acidimicrobiia bacterium]